MSWLIVLTDLTTGKSKVRTQEKTPTEPGPLRELLENGAFAVVSLTTKTPAAMSVTYTQVED